jgi:hypothetical protein
VSAEGRCVRPSALNTSKLQWGRALVSAEGRPS